MLLPGGCVMVIFAFDEDPAELVDEADDELPDPPEDEEGVALVVEPGVEPPEGAVAAEEVELLAGVLELEPDPLAGALADASPEKAVATSEEDR